MPLHTGGTKVPCAIHSDRNYCCVYCASRIDPGVSIYFLLTDRYCASATRFRIAAHPHFNKSSNSNDGFIVGGEYPLLLYFYFDDVSTLITDVEGYFKNEIVGAQSNMAFRLSILKYAFSRFDTTSFWYGSALAGNQTVSLALVPGWDWWFFLNRAGEVLSTPIL